MFCNNCGKERATGVQFCVECGAKAPNDAAIMPMEDAGESYLGNVHKFGSSNLFLAGAAAFTGASLFNFFTGLSGLSIFGLAMLALPATALWLIFFASKNLQNAGKFLPALTLVKIHTIILMVFICIGLAAVSLGGVGVIIGGAVIGGGFAVIIGLIAVLIATGLLVLYLIFYCIALLKIIKNIRTGLETSTFVPLQYKSFVIISWITIGFAALGALISIGSAGFMQGLYNELLHEIPWEFRGLIEDLLPSPGAVVFSGLLQMVSIAGQGILIVVFSRFATSVNRV